MEPVSDAPFMENMVARRYYLEVFALLVISKTNGTA